MAILTEWVRATFYITNSDGGMVEHALGVCNFSRLEGSNNMWTCVVDISGYHSDLSSLFVVIEAENGETMTIPVLSYMEKGNMEQKIRI